MYKSKTLGFEITLEESTMGTGNFGSSASAYYEQMEYPSKNFPVIVRRNSGAHLNYPHWHKECEIVYVLEGTLTFGIGGTIKHIRKGEIYFIPAGQVHYFYISPGCRRFVVQFSVSLFGTLPFSGNDFVVDRLLNSIDGNGHHWSKQLRREIQSNINRIAESSEGEKNWDRFVIICSLYNIVYQLKLHAPRLEKETISEDKVGYISMVDEIFKYIDNHYTQKITIKTAASVLGLQPNYFCRFFKKYPGESFLNFLNKYRLAKACYILENKEESIEDVAYQSGFQSYQTFYAQFKRHFGVSPHQYNKDNIQE